MAKRFSCPVGLSDHSLGTGVSVASVSLGAVMIEKHFTLSRRKKTADSFFSLEPKELKTLVEDVRLAEQALGETRYGLTEKEKESLVFRRSLFAVKDIKKGEVFNEDNIRSIRPANGLKPKYMKKIIGREAKKNIRRGTPISMGMFE
jgi:sialic acid synthase SpsE